MHDTFFFAVKATVVLIVFYNHFTVNAFVPTTTSSTSPSRSQGPDVCTSPLFAGMGMGMGATSSKKKKGKKKNKSKGRGLSSSSKKSTPFDVNASIIRLEKKYDELQLSAAKDLKKEEEEAESYSSWSSGEIEMITTEYVIAARDASKKGSIPDWVPICQLCLKRQETDFHEGASDEIVQTAISVYCRELSFLAAEGSRVFSTIARNEIQYSVESIDSFHKFVYDEVIEGKANKSPDQAMTKAEARKTLGLSENADEITKSDIRKAYRNLSFELHPDRFEGTPEECEEATNQFGRVNLAYDTLSSGVREEGKSWYESLGGKERTGFVGPVNLLPLGAAQETMSRHKAEAALCGLDPTMVQSFVARHLRSS
ncbi:unnamed protein product [Pseudo-nitzschia multistriata]|uniref:J domain-containing protein n=1 Tax=Pseudo-nitzschia multistriata TaxID=183589 RepID=A0A448ZSU4_9STRA|nr:unnamed protein product [Pseudo-nitzschia multistriata]